MTEHTPGPWRYEPDFGEIQAGYLLPVICRLALGDGDYHPGQTVQDPDERAANARLIAAAPELLAAAKRALEWYEPRLAPGEEGPVCAQLRSAIQNAQG